MEKSKHYKDCLFKAELIKSAIDKLFEEEDRSKVKSSYRLEKGDEIWEYDSESEYFADYRKEHKESVIRKSIDSKEIRITFSKNFRTTVSVNAGDRDQIESIFEIFEQNVQESKIEPSSKKENNPIIFIGHGKSNAWRDVKDHLTDKHGYTIETFETGARAGHTIRDVLEDMSNRSSFAILVMTGDDLTSDGKLKARSNVIHEVGLFQGKLGFSKAIVLLEKGTEEFSNLHGIQQIRFNKGNIKETFGDILATLKREFEK